MRQSSVEISVAGRKLKVACPQGQESALLFSAAEIDKRLEAIKKSNSLASSEQAMLMTALNLANELAAVQEQLANERTENKKQIALLQSSFEQALVTPTTKPA